LSISRKRLFVSTRPTGPLHLGNWFGALRNALNLQHEYDCYVMIADWDALTTGYMEPSKIREQCDEMLLDLLSIGLNPQRCTVFIQSQVRQCAELALLLGMLMPKAWHDHCASCRDKMVALGNKEIKTFGYSNEPVLGAADALLFRADAIAVGEDEFKHAEICEKLAERFNELYGATFPVPDIVKSPRISKLMGLDGRKMSKTLDNCIYLRDSRPAVVKKVRSLPTDPARVHRADPGNPDICRVCQYHWLFSEADHEGIVARCKAGVLGCVECKMQLAEAINRILDPFRENYAILSRDAKIMPKVVQGSLCRAQHEAEETMELVRKGMGIGEG
jgi:tryptophanyl-tRNA synthetase